MSDESKTSLLEVDFARGGFSIELRMEWSARSLVLFGPSGSGKTTLLRVMLGLERQARARLRLAGTWLEDPEQDLFVPIHQRRLGWVPQSPSLFPDRSVEDNIAFGARASGGGADLDHAVEVLELGDRLKDPVTRLSGGERQRVALARAIASGPRALLLDEPLASLDLALRARVLPFLLRIRDELDLPLVHITHDPDEAILLADELAILDGGRLVAQGEARETLWSRSVLPLSTRLGVENLLEAQGTPNEASAVRTRAGVELHTPWPVADGERLRLALRAEDIVIGLDRPGRLSARNVLPGEVLRIDENGDDRLVQVQVGGDRLAAKLTASAVRDLELEAGSAVYLIIKSQALRRL